MFLATTRWGDLATEINWIFQFIKLCLYLYQRYFCACVHVSSYLSMYGHWDYSVTVWKSFDADPPESTVCLCIISNPAKSKLYRGHSVYTFRLALMLSPDYSWQTTNPSGKTTSDTPSPLSFADVYVSSVRISSSFSFPCENFAP